MPLWIIEREVISAEMLVVHINIVDNGIQVKRNEIISWLNRSEREAIIKEDVRHLSISVIK